MCEIERLAARLGHLFSNADFRFVTQINERPGKLRRRANDLKRSLYSRRANERRAQNLVRIHQRVDGLFKATGVEISVDANHTERAERLPLNGLLQ